MGLIQQHVAGDSDLVCAYSDYGSIDARHNLQSDMLHMSSRFESIYYFGAWRMELEADVTKRGHHNGTSDIGSNGRKSRSVNIIRSGL